MPRPLPPLNAIRAFETAARHLNFSRAAEELGVTQGAISKQILALEDIIGARLFERRPGGLSLTNEGRALNESISPAFTMLGDAFRRYSRRPPRSNICRISTLASIAAQFLIPRLDAFEEELPHIELEILTSDRLIDLAREEVDLSVRYGPGGWDGVVSSELAKGKLTPVCAPALLKRALEQSSGDLTSMVCSTRRIQTFSNNEWRTWGAAAGVDLSDAKCTFIIEDFIVVIAAVVAGQGLALLPEILVREHLADGRMVTFSETAIDWDHTYHIVHAPNAERRPIVRDVIAWLKRETAA